ncbi:hypothetical protein [Nocardiopsis prasina]|uniref:hypothetical protein n=1 Tax=Nocardiopsis prasina TaxID=2015 RepID=UPI00034AF678|nr:hypothetical protein [Nocardiopsis prasina]
MRPGPSPRSSEHALTASLQARNPHLIIWYGERTGSYWIASPAGLTEVPDAQTLDRPLMSPECHRGDRPLRHAALRRLVLTALCVLCGPSAPT